MNSTENFKKVIREHLEQVAVIDPLFAESLKKPNKNINDCVTYILNTVKASGCNGFDDGEIFAMAIHYYDEDAIDIGSRMTNGSVVVNHKIELSEEEKKEAREKARKEFEEIQLRELRQSQERKEERERKKQEKLKKAEAEKKAQRAETEKKIVMAQPTLF